MERERERMGLSGWDLLVGHLRAGLLITGPFALRRKRIYEGCAIGLAKLTKFATSRNECIDKLVQKLISYP